MDLSQSQLRPVDLRASALSFSRASLESPCGRDEDLRVRARCVSVFPPGQR